MRFVKAIRLSDTIVHVFYERDNGTGFDYQTGCIEKYGFKPTHDVRQTLTDRLAHHETELKKLTSTNDTFNPKQKQMITHHTHSIEDITFGLVKYQ